MKIGILFDTPDDFPNADGPADRFAEFEPESTLLVMEEAIVLNGHTPVRLGGPKVLMNKKPAVDLVWNISEGYGTRNREAWGPVLLEMHQIPYLGSDAFTLSLSLDKSISKHIAQSLGIPTSPWLTFTGSENAQEWPYKFPAFCKPRYEGTGKGIYADNIADNTIALKNKVNDLYNSYKQDVLVEEWLTGAEFTVALWGGTLKPQPVLERAIHPETRLGSHITGNLMDTASKIDSPSDWHLTQQLTYEMEKKLQNWSVLLCKEMNVKHFVRLDFKCNESGHPFFLEINPLPTFAVDNTFAILAELEGESYPVYLSRILKAALQ